DRRRRARIEGHQPGARRISSQERRGRGKKPRQPGPGRLSQQQEKTPEQDERKASYDAVADRIQVRLLSERAPQSVKPLPHPHILVARRRKKNFFSPQARFDTFRSAR